MVSRCVGRMPGSAVSIAAERRTATTAMRVLFRFAMRSGLPILGHRLAQVWPGSSCSRFDCWSSPCLKQFVIHPCCVAPWPPHSSCVRCRPLPLAVRRPRPSSVTDRIWLFATVESRPSQLRPADARRIARGRRHAVVAWTATAQALPTMRGFAARRTRVWTRAHARRACAAKVIMRAASALAASCARASSWCQVPDIRQSGSDCC